MHAVFSDQSKLEDVLNAVERYAEEQPSPEDVYVWLDLFCSNPHAKAAVPMLWWQVIFEWTESS